MGSYSGKVPFSQYAEAVFREVYEGAFKGDFFCATIGTSGNGRGRPFLVPYSSSCLALYSFFSVSTWIR